MLVTRKEREAQEDALAEEARRVHTAPNHDLPANPRFDVIVGRQGLRVDLALLREQRDTLLNAHEDVGASLARAHEGLINFLDCILDAAEGFTPARPLPDKGLESDCLLD